MIMVILPILGYIIPHRPVHSNIALSIDIYIRTRVAIRYVPRGYHGKPKYLFDIFFRHQTHANEK